MITTSVSMTPITKLYIEKLIDGNGNINMKVVPALWKSKVKTALIAMLAQGEITQQQYDTYVIE